MDSWPLEEKMGAARQGSVWGFNQSYLPTLFCTGPGLCAGLDWAMWCSCSQPVLVWSLKPLFDAVQGIKPNNKEWK